MIKLWLTGNEKNSINPIIFGQEEAWESYSTVNMDHFLGEWRCINMYPGFVLIMNGKTADMEMTVMKDEVYTHRILKAGVMLHHTEP